MSQDFYPSCVNPVQVPITTVLKNQIVLNHNKFRNTIALGDHPDFNSAQRMAQLVWNDELAWLAQLNTRQCAMKHDACHNTAKFSNSGQNLGTMSSSRAHYKPSDVLDGVISNWFNENAYASQSDVDILTVVRNENK